MGYTKGPWEIIRARHGKTIMRIGECSAEEYAGLAWLEVSEENAHLIAAAPDLLEALEALANSAPDACCSDFNHRKGDFHDEGDECPPLERYASACLMARAAIARAKGES